MAAQFYLYSSIKNNLKINTINNENNENKNKIKKSNADKSVINFPLTLHGILLSAILEVQRGLEEDRAAALLGYLGHLQCVVDTTSMLQNTTSFSNYSSTANTTSFPSKVAMSIQPENVFYLPGKEYMY